MLSQVNNLAETPYFSAELDAYIHELRDVLVALMGKLDSDPPAINTDIATYLANHIWQLTQFLTGSTTKQIPYEVTFAIERAAGEWTKNKFLITTAIIQEANFYFHGSDRFFFDLVDKELGIKIQSNPVQIALPYIYRHKPLFCVPLFHELGHHVDAVNEVVKTSLLISPEDVGPDLPGLPPSGDIARTVGAERDKCRAVIQSHRAEYFADLFSAAYAGEAATGFLKEFIPNQQTSLTHPSSIDRFAVVNDFLQDKQNKIVDLFQATLRQRGLNPLCKRLKKINVDNSFGNIRPHTLNSDEEIYGLFEAGWEFLIENWRAPEGLWANISPEDRERIVNDLVEKSIRNRMILEGWNAALNTH